MKFAHMADIHLGFQKLPALQGLEAETFGRMIDECITRKVDFVLMCGDLFHVNIPEMRVQKMAMNAFRMLHEAGIPVYAVYGSHDFSPVSNSAIDLLDSAGYITKVTRAEIGEKISLTFLEDERTGAKLTGLSGLKAGRDVEHYERLDVEPLEAEPGFKIFLYHGAIREMIGDARDDASMPVDYLPGGFDYYAGGHMHNFRHESFKNHKHVVYPGTPFAGFHSDLEMNARGEKRGFVVVNVNKTNKTIKKVEFVEVPACKYVITEVSADGKSAEDVNAELTRLTENVKAANKVVIIRVSGELASGRTADIDLLGVRKRMGELEAIETVLDRNGLTSKEYEIRGDAAGTRDEIEERVFRDNINQVGIKLSGLTGDDGVKLAGDLLATMRQPRPENEKTKDYEHRITSEATSRMGLAC